MSDMEEYYDEEESGGSGGVAGSIGGACCLCVLGLVMFPAALFCLGYNERRAVCQSRAIMSVESEAKVASCTDNAAANHGSLVFYNCPVDEDSISKAHLSDFEGMADFTDVKFTDKRPACYQQTASMYQCVEDRNSHTDNKGKTRTSYQYSAKFSTTVVQSDSFSTSGSSMSKMRAACGSNFVRNPDMNQWHVKAGVETIHAGSATAGVYTLNSAQLKQVTCDDNADVKPWTTPIFAESSTQPPASGFTRSSARVVGGTLETCDPSQVRTGCMRLQYKATHLSHAAVLGSLKADGSTENWMAPSSFMCSGIALGEFHYAADTGSWGIQDLLAHMHSANDSLTWILRVCGLLAAWLGVYLVFAPIKMLADGADALLDYIPVVGDFLGDVVNGVVTCMLIAISFALSVPIGLIVIAIVWAVMRPLIGIPLLIVAVAILCWGVCSAHSAAEKGKGRKKKKGKLVEMSDRHTSDSE